MKNIRKVLILNGLTEKQASVYLALLSLKHAPASKITAKAGVKRPTAYVILDELEEKRLVSSEIVNGTKLFHALNPSLFLEQQQNKTTALASILPDLQALHESYSYTPVVKVFEGVEGLKKMMEDTLSSKGDIYFWADMRSVTNVFEDYWKEYIRKRVAKNIWARGILTDDSISLEFQRRGKQELREVYLVSRDKFPFKNEINIYANKISIISHADLSGVIIENQNIADMQRSIFKLAFEYAKLSNRVNKS